MSCPRPALASALALALLATAACGSGAPDRPVLVASDPADGSVLPGLVSEIRITYDEAVRILNPAQARLFSPVGQLAIEVREDPADDRSLLIRPVPGESFIPNAEHALLLEPGIVVNDDDQYGLEDDLVIFELGDVGPFYVTDPAGAAVAGYDATTFAAAGSTPTPGGRAPLGLAATHLGADARLWVQLGGAGDALATFAPGDAAMTPVALTPQPASSLLATGAAIGRSRDGRVVYAAFRDDATGRASLHRIDVATQMEILPSLLLSPASGAATAPLGLVVDRDGSRLFVSVRTDTTDRLVEVDLATFGEVDIGDDAGVDGVMLPEGAGPLAEGEIARLVAPPLATAHLTAYRPAFGTVEELPSLVPGMPNAVAVTPDRFFALEGLAMAVDDEAIVRTPIAAPGTLEAEVVVDDVGAGPRAVTTVTTLLPYPASARVLALLGPGSVATFTWDADGLIQEDLDAMAPDVQTVELAGLGAADRREAVFLPGAWPAP